MEKLIRNSFDFVNRNKNPWFLKANELLHSALRLREISIDASKKLNQIESGDYEPGSLNDYLFKDWSTFNQATMLFGFSIENFLKGLWVNQNNININMPYEKLPSELKEHSLVKLAEGVHIKFTDSEKFVLNQLTTSILWLGRYPIPINVQEYSKHFKSRPAFFVENGTKGQLPVDVFSILKKIDEKIKNSM